MKHYNKTIEVYTTYASDSDMTFIIMSKFDEISVVGWHFGEPYERSFCHIADKAIRDLFVKGVL